MVNTDCHQDKPCSTLECKGHARAALLKWKSINERVIVARFLRDLKITRTKRYSCLVYVPTEDGDAEDKERYYSEMNGLFDRIAKGVVVILMGDMNAKTGSDNTNRERIMGRHGLGAMNENGELCAEFCGNHDLVIGGSTFAHKISHKVTWASHDGVTENQIGHICISHKWRRSILDVRNKRSADIASDHHLFIGSGSMRVMAVRRNDQRLEKRFAVGKLADPGVRTRFISGRAVKQHQGGVRRDW